MAEFVQQSIEEMLPELEQMERIGLFTTGETKTILKKRKGYEYKLRRRTKCKDDYLNYLKYEIKVLELVQLRRKKTGFTFKTLEVDVAISHRIHSLFNRATVRFQDDVKLWLSHIQFSRERKEKSLVSKLFTKMLQVHSKKPDLWTLAAKWEFEENMNAENARSLLQRGLRFNATSKCLWLEYYRMELLYAQKLRKRREILAASSQSVEEEEVPDSVLDGEVAMIVYKKARESFPDDVDFLLSFLPICRLFEFTKNHEERIFQDMDELFSDKPQTWEAKALRHLHQKEKGRIEKCFKVFEEAIESIPGETIWSMYVNTCLDLIAKKKSTSKKYEKLIQKALTVFQNASNRRLLVPSLYEKWVDILTNNGQTDKAQGVLKDAVQQNPHSVLLWKQYLLLLIQNQSEESQILEAFREANKTTAEKESLPLWDLVLNYLIVCKSKAVIELFKKGTLSCREVCEPVKEQYLKWSFLTEGIAAARKIYSELAKIKPISLGFFKEYISMENAQAKPDMENIQTAFEDALQEYGETSSDIWIDYIKHEMSSNTHPEDVGNIHFRAVKSLKGEENQRFVTQYTLLQTGHL